MRSLVWLSLAYGVTMALVAVSPTLPLALAAMVLVGVTSVAFMSIGNSTLQLASAPHMRGRVMALWTVAFLGSTPIGGPIAGWVSQEFGGRAGLALGAVACFVAAGMGLLALRRRPAPPATIAPPTAPTAIPRPATPEAA
jgi:MFS family permease